jgi:hypothetical protein
MEEREYDLENCDLCYRRDPDCPSYHRGLPNAILLKRIVFDVFAELAAANSTGENKQVLLRPCFLLSTLEAANFRALVRSAFSITIGSTGPLRSPRNLI